MKPRTRMQISLRSSFPFLLCTFLLFCTFAASCTLPSQKRHSETQLSVEPSGAEDSAGSGVSSATAVVERSAPAGFVSEEHEELDHQLKVAKAELEIARLKAHQENIQARAEFMAAERDMQLAMDDFENFNEVRQPLQMREAELDLQSSEDSTREVEEELQQLKMMYGEDELGEMTAEIVVARTERRVQRSRERLELERLKYKNLTEFTMPNKVAELEAAIDEANAELKAAEANLEAVRMESQLEFQNAEREIMNLEQQIKELLAEIS